MAEDQMARLKVSQALVNCTLSLSRLDVRNLVDLRKLDRRCESKSCPRCVRRSKFQISVLVVGFVTTNLPPLLMKRRNARRIDVI